MKFLTSLLIVAGLALLAGCSGAPTTPQEAAADQRAMSIANQNEQDQMDVDMGYTDPAAEDVETGQNPILDTETPE